MGKKSIWDILEWVSVFVILAYLFLKLIGVLKSPFVADATLFISAAYFLGVHVQKLNHVIEELKEIKATLKEHIQDKEVHE